MHLGLFLEFDRREDLGQADAFTEAFRQVDLAEELGLHSVWLSERHFQPGRSVLSSPIVIASAIASRTERVRMGIAVQVLPLTHPVRLAEEAATVDQISRGRFEFGVGRSGFPRSYHGYNIPYAESQGRFRECLEVVVKAWTNDEFSYDGEFYNFHNVCLSPKPYQQPHPPIRMAATTSDTFPMVGRMGLPVFVGLRGTNVEDLVGLLSEYRKAWKEAGVPGTPDVGIRMPVYAAETMEKARSEPEESTMANFRRLGGQLEEGARLDATLTTEERAERARRLGEITYDEVLEQKVAFGDPDYLVERLTNLKELLGLSMVVAEVNPGGRVPADQVLNSIRLMGEEVLPLLNQHGN